MKEIEDILQSDASLTERIAKELEALYLKRDEILQALADLENRLPVMNEKFKKLSKALGIKINGITDQEVKDARSTLEGAVTKYKQLKKDLADIEKSIDILEAEIDRV
jgi:predicted  nucleic acid-binding Zn-ribbon protein